MLEKQEDKAKNFEEELNKWYENDFSNFSKKDLLDVLEKYTKEDLEELMTSCNFPFDVSNNINTSKLADNIELHLRKHNFTISDWFFQSMSKVISEDCALENKVVILRDVLESEQREANVVKEGEQYDKYKEIITKQNNILENLFKIFKPGDLFIVGNTEKNMLPARIPSVFKEIARNVYEVIS